MNEKLRRKKKCIWDYKFNEMNDVTNVNYFFLLNSVVNIISSRYKVYIIGILDTLFM